VQDSFVLINALDTVLVPVRLITNVNVNQVGMVEIAPKKYVQLLVDRINSVIYLELCLLVNVKLGLVEDS
jgi:hypothetical protein